MKKLSSPYQGQLIALATMHKKELYLNPACEKILGASLLTFDDKLNTDLLGTFSGEIERKGNQKEIALEKCKLGLDMSGLPLGIANEGSFGPHPYIPFIPSSCETLVFVDSRRNLKIFETSIFKKTNFQHTICNPFDDLTHFLNSSLFPSHGLIIRPNVWKDKTVLFKGVQDFIQLQKSITICCQNSIDDRAHLATDMRAHMNPTRGLNIRKLGIRLFRRLTRLCPICHAPGWGRTNIKKGRPCSICEYPSELPISYVWSCSSCSHQEEEPFPDVPKFADPGYCSMCNP
jgi:hypothetical protein